jgi:glycosyltransferase involved in cell wall biosynthesis
MKMAPQQPLVSIGLPVYNGEATIEKTIKSLLLQDYINFEIIVSDNGSTDSTPWIVERLAQKSPKITFHRSNYNRGAIWNFNRVFELSNGEYFMWASHDDERANNYISRCLHEIQKRPTAALCAPNTVATWGKDHSGIWVSELGSFTYKTEPKTRYLETLKNFPAVALYGIYRSTFVKKTNLLPQVMGADLLFIQNLAMYGDIIGFNEILFTYHQREKWNTVDQDYRVFFGKEPKPRWYWPFFVYSYWQVKLVLKATLRFPLKCQLILCLFGYQARQLLQKIGLKLIRHLVPNAFRQTFATLVYWKYLHSPNIQVLDSEKFEERIIKPTLRLNA